jgi:2-dehydro-3-deoxygluconokinase
MKSLLGIGECMMELSSMGDQLWKQGFAGDVFNTLWYARALMSEDSKAEFFTAVGDDENSKELLSFVENAGISCAHVPHIKGGVPGLYKIHLNGAERSFSYWRDSSAARKMMQDPEQLWKAVAQTDVVYLSGITMAILPDDAAEVLINGLRNALSDGAIVVFDPNIRPRLWANEERMKDIITRTAAISDVVMPSFEDEQITFGDETPMATAQRYQALGVSQVVVKNGEDDTLFAENDMYRYFPVAQASGVVDTTAAGDSFNGAYLAEFMASGDIDQAIAVAQRCAATVVCNKGALVAFDLVQAG